MISQEKNLKGNLDWLVRGDDEERKIFTETDSKTEANDKYRVSQKKLSLVENSHGKYNYCEWEIK